MPDTQYTPDMSRLNRDASAIRQKMLGGQDAASVDLSASGPATPAAPAPAPATPTAPAPAPMAARYGAPGDPWVYEVSPDGTIRAGTGDQLIDVVPGTVIHEAIKDQLSQGVLQPDQGAAAPAGAPGPPGVPEPIAPEPAVGVVPPEAPPASPPAAPPEPPAAPGLDMTPAPGRNYSPWEHGANPPPAFDAAPLRDPQGSGVANFLHQATSGGPQALEAREMLKNVIREALAERQQAPQGSVSGYDRRSPDLHPGVGK